MLAPQVPQTASNEGVIEAAKAALGASVLDVKDHVGEVTLTVARDAVVEVCRTLRDTPGLEYQQLMEIAGVDYPERAERFEVNYHLLSLTQNRRVRVKVLTDEVTPVPSITSLWPVAGWLEREVFDLYGVTFAGNADLRRILTDYGFEGFPLRKDFPLTGHTEMRYSEAEKRVVYEPVSLPQDFRTFDFLTPWEGPEYRLPGDEKAEPQAAGAASPAPASGEAPKVVAAPAKDAGKREPPYAGDNEERARKGAKEADAEASKSNEAKAQSEVSKPSDTPDPKPKGGANRRRPGGGTA
ncbi:NADH-quinone oxidoreductase subunit C [Sphingomonas piscis]|uniref:NADH-quinone oxidoreductase subunit C n=1 Tax=Sphingomonas piscis TaxID=2714943 RepID=A0A6G7YSN4_9SPHN|nr:NADH-quinone oxidoreductase subunit C [Sphingomonas piscis]QIK79744.1 NADH-quinone oxidoreductase subunit C [Sphingomonas piscis]